MSAPQFYKIKLIQKKIIASGIWELRFEKPTGFSFKAGQFVQFKIPTSGENAFRSYSISSPPSAAHLEFCIKYLPDGVASRHFDAMQPGESVDVSEPKGAFTPVHDGKKNYFIATGTGLAPIMAMLESHPVEMPFQLLFGVRTEEDIFWLSRLQQLHQKNPNFTFEITLSKPGENWTGKRGRVIEYLSIESAGHYYICGSVEMVKDVRSALLKSGMDTKSVHFEIF